MTRLVVLSRTVIQHSEHKHMCGNRDKTQTLCLPFSPHTMQTHTRVERMPSPGAWACLNLLIGCVFWQANLENRTVATHQSAARSPKRPQECMFNEVKNVFIHFYNEEPHVVISACLSQAHICLQRSDAVNIWICSGFSLSYGKDLHPNCMCMRPPAW